MLWKQTNQRKNRTEHRGNGCYEAVHGAYGTAGHERAVTDESEIGTAEERTGKIKDQESGSKFIKVYGKSR